jgi:hypothetical protein
LSCGKKAELESSSAEKRMDDGIHGRQDVILVESNGSCDEAASVRGRPKRPDPERHTNYCQVAEPIGDVEK